MTGDAKSARMRLGHGLASTPGGKSPRSPFSKGGRRGILQPGTCKRVPMLCGPIQVWTLEL